MGQHDRQSFLGPTSETDLETAIVGIVGLGGGGSHVVQQLAHVGVGNYVIADPDIVEDTNLNRLVGATRADVESRTLKIAVAERVIRGVLGDAAQVSAYDKPWQEVLSEFRDCDLIIGAIDSLIAKAELDQFCRRFMIPYIDMGMDVHEAAGRYLIAGQVVLSAPGTPCLRCMGIVTDANINDEAKRYGSAGGKPQVVWPNGVLASAAVGLFTQLICPWHGRVPAGAYLEYDGNKHIMTPSLRYERTKTQPCPHFTAGDLGDAFFDVRVPPEKPSSRPSAGASGAIEAPSWLKWWRRWFL